MSIDDSTIREQARNIILDHARSVEYPSIANHLTDFEEFRHLPEHEFRHAQGRVEKQVRNAVVTVSWPDERKPANTVSGEQQDGAVEAVQGFADAWNSSNDVVCETADYTLTIGTPSRATASMTVLQLLAVLAERDALAARVAELEADRTKWADPVCGVYHPEAEAFTAREARAEAAAQAGDETDGSGTTPRDWWRTRGACRYCGCDVHQDDPAEPVGDGVAHPACHRRAQEWVAECAARRDTDASKESGT